LTKLYWAYGSNLNIRQMRGRCPAAVPLEALTVKNLVLRFRGVADVGYLPGAHCEGALWEITRECEEALDAYEGVGSGGHGGLYRKCYFDYVDPDTGTPHKVLYYKMNRSGIMPPSEGYLDCIVEGYGDFDIDTARLRRAVEHAWRRKDVNGFLSYRWNKAGKPRMARIERLATVRDEAEPLVTEDIGEELTTPPIKLTKCERKALRKALRKAESKERLPDVCLRADPDNQYHCRAVTVTDKGKDFFADNIKAVKLAREWLFKFSTHTVAGLLQKKGLSVAILEKLRK
jgi:hypothetical protein